MLSIEQVEHDAVLQSALHVTVKITTNIKFITSLLTCCGSSECLIGGEVGPELNTPGEEEEEEGEEEELGHLVSVSMYSKDMIELCYLNKEPTIF